MDQPLHILLVEDEEAHARLVEEAVASSTLHHVTWVQSLDAARLVKDADVVLLDLGLGPTNGLETLTEFRSFDSRLPVVVLSSQANMDVALEAMRRGAQEYLVKGTFEDMSLHRACRYAIERKRMQEFEQLLIGVVGHDLRTPLQIIEYGTDLCLRDDGLSEASRSALQKVARAGARCERLVVDLLDVTLMRTGGQLPFNKEKQDVREPVAAVVRDVRALYPEREITLDAEVPIEVICDVERIEQAVTNLITNALQHGSESGTVHVRVGLGTRCVEIAVKNTGSHVDPSQMIDLFEPLARGEESGRGSFGLGLYIVSQIVDGHDGDLEVTSDEDSTTFTIRLPAFV